MLKKNAILTTMQKKMKTPSYSCSISENDKKNTNEKSTSVLILFLGTCRMQSWQFRRNFFDKKLKGLFQRLKLFNIIFCFLSKNVKTSLKFFLLENAVGHAKCGLDKPAARYWRQNGKISAQCLKMIVFSSKSIYSRNFLMNT